MSGKTEDQVRDEARNILGLEDDEQAKSGAGQLTTFNQLGFEGVSDKPDGWYLPADTSKPALILEAKSTKNSPFKQAHIDELLKNIKIAQRKYSKVVGVLYNGQDVLAFKGDEQFDVVPDLQPKEYYLGVFVEGGLDKERIYTLTKRINDSLHKDFGISDLYQRMIFTACALVAEHLGAKLASIKGQPYEVFKMTVSTRLSSSLRDDIQRNNKLNYLIEAFGDVKMNYISNQSALNAFIENVCEISEYINSKKWRGEDVMGIFFNEFNRYKGKSEAGQVFTPDHITSLMYRLIEVNKDDRVLDAACGTGAFLTKAMYNMIEEAGGFSSKDAPAIKSEQIFGVEYDKQVYALACANMLIHKDGKSNLEWGDSRTEDIGEWIASKNITKVLMNPPFEKAYGCMKIVENVLNHVSVGAKCAFILPDKKLEKESGSAKRIKKKHTLRKIIKLPENTFWGVGVSASIYIFEAHIPQKDKEIFTCYIEEDGLITVKNQGRHDVWGKWPDIEDRWVKIIHHQAGDDTIKWIKPDEHMSYQMPEKPFEIYEEDFRKTVMDYIMFQQGIDAKDFTTKLSDAVMYQSEVKGDDGTVNIAISVKGDDGNE